MAALSRSFWRASERWTRAIEGQQWLDRPSYKLEHGLALVFNLFGDQGKPLQDALHGRWLGSPLHSAVTDVPVGAWTTALLLDGLDVARVGRPGMGRAAQAAVGLGLAGAAVSATSGVTDWQYSHDDARRAGLVHAAINAVATGLYAISWRDRRSGRAARARTAAAAGYAVVLAGAHLGGVLVHRHRLGVDHSDPSLEPRDFVPVADEDELVEGVPRRVEYDEGAAVLVRHRGRLFGVGEHCAHLGAPMVEGWLYRDGLVCPWHGSIYDLETGEPLRGPSTHPLPCFETRVREGRVELRRVAPVPGATPGSTLGSGGQSQRRLSGVAEASGPGEVPR